MSRHLLLTHAVLVAGHAILRDTHDVCCDDSWFLLPFQRGEAACYVGHVRCGVELAASDPGALLIFTGGQSRIEAGAQSEAVSYWRVAEHLGWFGRPEVRDRAITEEFSRDSFENLLFGICRFREYSCRYPERVTMVSWAFKKARLDLHREAVRWPGDRFAYAGPNNPPELDQALASESKMVEAYTLDPYSSGAVFRAKRDSRNPFRRRHGYLETSPELKALFAHEGPKLFDGTLPWD